MNYVLTVIGGTDEGKMHRLEEGRECLVGRSPSAAFVLRDETVAWEHAMLRADGNRIVLQNLSALGTKVKGKRVTDEVRLSPTDEIQLSESCRLTVEPETGGRNQLSPVAGLLIAVIILVLVAGASAFLLLGGTEPAVRPVTQSHWRTGYNRIEERMSEWSGRGEFPSEGLLFFRDGWRLEQANNPEAALAKWNALRSMLLRTPLPGPNPDDRTITETADTTPRALGIIMGWDLQGSATFQWDTDEAYADALVWFVRRRCQINGESVPG